MLLKVLTHIHLLNLSRLIWANIFFALASKDWGIKSIDPYQPAQSEQADKGQFFFTNATTH